MLVPPFRFEWRRLGLLLLYELHMEAQDLQVLCIFVFSQQTDVVTFMCFYDSEAL